MKRILSIGGLLALGLAVGCAQAPDMFPLSIAGGSRTALPAVYNAQTIFDYMDGAAEIYFTYAFRRLYVAFYRLGKQQVTAEVYDMSTPAEAFGIFTNDLEGEPVEVAQGARYLEGTLRCWQDRFFVKIRGEQDTPELRPFAIQLAHYIATQVQREGNPPALTAALPKALQPRDLRYFHRDTNLNNFYYVSTENVLALSEKTEGVLADGQWEGKPVKVILLQYPTPAARDEGWKGFCEKVLSPQAKTGPAGERIEEFAPEEFTGIRRFLGPRGEPRLVLCFEAKTAEDCRAVLAEVAREKGGQ
ncbi:MAG TPA: hypothetical protein EYP85_15930 [Armatimonadetes bacterium]|nr:hypothetical protein [Armatimonadota bacterium]